MQEVISCGASMMHEATYLEALQERVSSSTLAGLNELFIKVELLCRCAGRHRRERCGRTEEGEWKKKVWVDGEWREEKM